MNQKRNWTTNQDQVIKVHVQQMGNKPKWKIVAQKVNEFLQINDPSYRRSSKQCRQRWHNKLNPSILDHEWLDQQIDRLFQLHNKHGNKWSFIAGIMNGRTDNCVKNKFYSTLRKGMRKINKFIVNLKRKLKINKSLCIKQFKEIVLTKLIAVADKKYDDRLDIKHESRDKTQKLSQAIKLALVQVSKNQDDYVGHVNNGISDDFYQVQHNLIRNIQEFCRNCKRKKGKKTGDQDQQQSMIDQSQNKNQYLYQNQSKNQKQNQIDNIQASKSDHSKFQLRNSRSDLSKSDPFDDIAINNQKINTSSYLNQDKDKFGTINSLFSGHLGKNTQSSFQKFNFQSIFEQNEIRKPQKTKRTSMCLDISIDRSIKNMETQKKPTHLAFFDSIPSVIPNINIQKTDAQNNTNNFRIEGIFRETTINGSDHSGNLSGSISNINFFADKSISLSFLSRSRGLQNLFDLPNDRVFGSSSLSNSSMNLLNRQQRQVCYIQKQNANKQRQQSIMSPPLYLSNSMQISHRGSDFPNFKGY